jgi:hypothetical protein
MGGVNHKKGGKGYEEGSKEKSSSKEKEEVVFTTI